VLPAFDASARPAPSVDLPGPGFGQAVSQILRVDPQAAGLSAGVELGIAKAGHQNRSSLATSRVFDPGLTGLILAADNCRGEPGSWPGEEQPQPIRADSDDDRAAEASDTGFERRVTATDQPLAHAEIVSSATAIPGVLGVGASRADAESGLVGEGVREAWSSVEIDGVDLLGGIVRLSRLRWESRHRGGLEDTRTGSFTVGALEIAGTAVPVDNPTTAFDAANTVLGPFGIRLLAPAVHESGDVLFVDPLAVVIEPSPQRDALAGALVRAAQPGREALLDILFDVTCDVAGLVTVADVLAGSVTGAGRLSFELGGTEATTATIAPTARLGAPPGSVTAPVSPQVLSTGTGGGTTAPAARPPVASSTAAPAESVAAPPSPALPVAALPFPEPDRDLAAAVGLATMVLGAVLVEADRRTMRRAQRAAAASAAAAAP
jgi:hypothetical protein